jgi:hypothetical protein
MCWPSKRLAMILALSASTACGRDAPPGDAGNPPTGAPAASAPGEAPAAGALTGAQPDGLDAAPCVPPGERDPSAAPSEEESPRSPEERIALVEALEAELAVADDAEVPALLLRLGRAMPRVVGFRLEPPDSSFLSARLDQYGVNESYGERNYDGQAFQDLITRYPESELADDAGYEMTLLAFHGECEGWIPCYVQRDWGPLSRFLTAFPQSPIAAYAVDRALAAFEQVPPTAELRYETEAGSPTAFASLAAALDSVGSLVAPPHGNRLSERAALIWGQLMQYDRARASLRAALADVQP